MSCERKDTSTLGDLSTLKKGNKQLQRRREKTKEESTHQLDDLRAPKGEEYLESPLSLIWFRGLGVIRC